jgi:hypothetical protein
MLMYGIHCYFLATYWRTVSTSEEINNMHVGLIQFYIRGRALSQAKGA